MDELDLLCNIRDVLNFTYVIWHDGENYQLNGNKQELYGYLYRLRKMLNAREENAQNN